MRIPCPSCGKKYSLKPGAAIPRHIKEKIGGHKFRGRGVGVTRKIICPGSGRRV